MSSSAAALLAHCAPPPLCDPADDAHASRPASPASWGILTTLLDWDSTATSTATTAAAADGQRGGACPDGILFFPPSSAPSGALLGVLGGGMGGAFSTGSDALFGAALACVTGVHQGPHAALFPPPHAAAYGALCAAPRVYGDSSDGEDSGWLSAGAFAPCSSSRDAPPAPLPPLLPPHVVHAAQLAQCPPTFAGSAAVACAMPLPMPPPPPPAVTAARTSPSRTGRAASRARVTSDGYAPAKVLSVSVDVLRQHFGLNLLDAARQLGMCRTTLKRICRQHGINRWPKRELAKNAHTSSGAAAAAAAATTVMRPQLRAGGGGIPVGSRSGSRHSHAAPLGAHAAAAQAGGMAAMRDGSDGDDACGATVSAALPWSLFPPHEAAAAEGIIVPMRLL
jgi:hypothetical protein